jgi:hypothetical protein
MNQSKTKSIFHTFKKIRDYENSILEFEANDDLLDQALSFAVRHTGNDPVGQ